MVFDVGPVIIDPIVYAELPGPKEERGHRC